MALHNDLTTGGVRGHIVRFAMPLIISNLLQAMYNAVDMFFVGRFSGKEGLAAVSVSGPLMNIMIMTVSGLSVGVAVLIGLLEGEGAHDDLKKAVNTSIALYAVCSVFVTAAGIAATPLLLRLVNTPQGAFAGAQQYLSTIFAGIVFLFGYNLNCAFQRGFGDARSSMLFVAAAAVTNIVLDALFIGAFSMGPFGAALATVLSQALSFFLGVLYFRKKKHVVTFSPREIRFHGASLRRLLHLGLPAAGHQLLLNVSLVTLSGIANGFGLAASAAYGIGLKIDSFALLPSDAINSSVSSFASQNVGAGKPERAVKGMKESLKLALLISAAIAALVFLFAPQLSALFNSDDEVVNYAVGYLRISCLSYFLYAIVHPLIGFLRGTGNAMATFWNVILSQYAVRIPVALVCTHFFGWTGVALALLAGPLYSVLHYAHFIISGKWKRSREIRQTNETKN